MRGDIEYSFRFSFFHSNYLNVLDGTTWSVFNRGCLGRDRRQHWELRRKSSSKINACIPFNLFALCIQPMTFGRNIVGEEQEGEESDDTDVDDDENV